jgi:hypothetical protein
VDRRELPVSAAAWLCSLPDEELLGVLALGKGAARARAGELRRAGSDAGREDWDEDQATGEADEDGGAGTSGLEEPEDAGPRPMSEPRIREERAAEVKEELPGASAAGATSKTVAGELTPPPGWLEGFPLRAQLGDPARFDCEAMIWWIAQQVLTRYGLLLGEDERRAGAQFASFDPDLIDLALLTEHPGTWTACVACAGVGREYDAACSSCRGAGFRTKQVEPATIQVGRSSPAPARSEKGQPTGTAQGAAKPKEADPTRPRRAGSRGA